MESIGMSIRRKPAALAALERAALAAVDDACVDAVAARASTFSTDIGAVAAGMGERMGQPTSEREAEQAILRCVRRGRLKLATEDGGPRSVMVLSAGAEVPRGWVGTRNWWK
jgi:hypothetical protein